jgi:Flp pilus assembly protein TadD
MGQMAKRRRRALGVAISLTLALALASCASWEGARLYQSGTAALDRGDSARAIADLERAAELVPTASEIQNHLGLAYAAAGRDDDARKAFRRAVDLDCGNRAAALNLRVAEQRHREVRP